MSILEQEQALREAGHLQKHRGSNLSLFSLQRLKKAVSVASGSSLKFGTPRPWNPNDSSGQSPRAELWLRVLWTAAIVRFLYCQHVEENMENTTQARTHAGVSRLPWPENLCRQLPGKEKPFSPLSTWLVFNIAKFERAPWDGRGPVKRNTARKFNNRPWISVFCSLGAPVLPCADETLQR